jgi:hypothetical protein
MKNTSHAGLVCQVSDCRKDMTRVSFRHPVRMRPHAASSPSLSWHATGEPVRLATNYVSRLEGGGAAPGIDLAARLAAALGVAVAELLPTKPDLAVTRRQAKKLCDELVESEDRAMLLLLTQLLVRLSEAMNR